MTDDFRFHAADVLDGARDVLLYGAGNTGRKVLRAIRGAGGTVRAFLDAGARVPGEVDGIPVLAPFPNPFGPDAAGVPVVLTVFNRDADTVAIGRSLHRHGYGPIVSYPALHARFHDRLGDDFWLGAPGLVERNLDRIAEVERLFRDDTSRAVYRSLIALYGSRDPGAAPVRDPRDTEYLPTDVPGWPPAASLRLVDCGAYDGDTLQRFRAAGIPIEAAACFEPDPGNYGLLCARVAGWVAGERAGISLWPCGVAAHTGTVAFDDGLGESSHVSDSASGRPVTCVALDDALPGFAPNLVKLDVEGAEESALRGMVRMAAAHRPALAVSVYHRPADLWELPAQVDAWGLGYRFHLRSCGFNGFDTVCYAVAAP
jgi:FkbM family methyltransferase